MAGREWEQRGKEESENERDLPYLESNESTSRGTENSFILEENIIFSEAGERW